MLFIGILLATVTQSSSSIDIQIPPTHPSNVCTIPALTQLKIEVKESISSVTAHVGDHVALRLSEPLQLNGRIVLATGSLGIGEVIHAASKAQGGKGGELILAARSLIVSGVTIPLRSFRVNAAAYQDHDIEWVGFTPVKTITSTDVEIPAGTHGTAKVSISTDVPCN